MWAGYKTGRQSEGKIGGIWEKIKGRLGLGRRAEGDRKNDRVVYITAGLGNPAREYEKTRHNMDSEIVDALADRLGTTVEEKKFKGCYRGGIIGGQKMLLLKPQTFVNLSSESVRTVADFYKVDPEHVTIAYDNVGLNVGQLRVWKKGSAGDHNGIKNIISHLETQEFPHIRVGMGDKLKKMNLADYVLSRLPKEDRAVTGDMSREAAGTMEMMITQGADAAISQFNGHKD